MRKSDWKSATCILDLLDVAILAFWQTEEWFRHRSQCGEDDEQAALMWLVGK